LEDFGRDAHARVARCDANKSGGVHGKQEQFNEHQRRRRELDIRTQVAQRCRKDLEDVGMQDLVARHAGTEGAGATNMDLDGDELLAMELLANDVNDDVAWDSDGVCDGACEHG
jgi:hypothetical protein